MTELNRRILGQIIRLTRSILLREPLDEKSYQLQFSARIPGLPSLGIGPVVTLWKTKTSFDAIEVMARMIQSCHPEATNCDTDTIEDLIGRTIEDRILDKEIFDVERIIFASEDCLFDCRADSDVNEFASLIYAHLATKVRESTSQWCTVLGVPRLICESFDITHAGLSLISRFDESKWKEVVSSSYQTNGWSQLLGCMPGSSSPHLFDIECPSLVVHLSRGSQKGSRFSSRLEFAKFFAVLYATATVQEQRKLQPSIAEPYRQCIQFPSHSGNGLQVTQSQLEEAVFPFLCSDVRLSNNAVRLILGWYDGHFRLDAEKRARVDKASHFVNRGIMTRGLDSYVNFFISLDALFGVSGDVGDSIRRGVESAPVDRALKTRITKLYELRNELVHGGSRYCAEWKGYEAYYAHFRARPEEDIKRIACGSLLGSVIEC